jgi:hypothetical protein
MNVEGEPPLAHIAGEFNRLQERVADLEQDVSRLVEIIEHLYTIVNAFCTGRAEELQQLKALVAQLTTFARERLARLTQSE